MNWPITSRDKTTGSVGTHLVYARRHDHVYRDITFFRGIPLSIDSYTFSDPYSDATAQLTFPQITELDDLDEVWWCQEFTQIDIYWAPASQNKLSPYDYPAVDPDTGQIGWWINVDQKGDPIWEGHTYSYAPTAAGTTVQCQGAMFALDRYISKPTYPPRPWSAEALILKGFNSYPTHLKKFKKSDIQWPTGWAKLYDNSVLDGVTQINNFTVDGLKIGDKWTGFATRNTGNWGRMLTGFVSELLGVMYTPDDCGVVEGNQWTIYKGVGRQPYLTVRDRFRTPDYSVYAGTPGINISLTRDALATSNVIYGSGTSTDGSKWANTAISPDGSATEYLPIAYYETHYPYTRNPDRVPGISGETMIQFGSGVGLDQAIVSAQKMLARDSDAGWVGDIELLVDPASNFSKWDIRPGQCIQVKNYAGLGQLNLHIAQVQCMPNDGRVVLSVDSKFRDLLTLEEVTAKIRDPLTPAKLLKVGERTGILEDHLAPWDYTAGSGMVTTDAKEFFLEMPRNIRFPWTEWLAEFPPRECGEYYVPVAANKYHSKYRWNAASFLTASAGTIRLTQFVCVDAEGNILPIPFHVSIHDTNVIDDAKDLDDGDIDDGSLNAPWWWASIPQDPSAGTEKYSPFANAKMWMRTDPTGKTLEGTTFYPPESMIVGWGTYDQPAGYSPGRKTDGSPPTGMLLDESTWSFDNVGGSSIERIDPKGRNASLTKTKLVAAFYAEYTETVYFIGRMWRNEPGY